MPPKHLVAKVKAKRFAKKLLKPLGLDHLVTISDLEEALTKDLDRPNVVR